MRLPDPHRSHAVLIGTSSYATPELIDLPAVRNNLTDLAAVLVEPMLGGLSDERCSVLLDPTDVRSVYRILRDQAMATEDTLLVYFAGHGLTGRRNELYLALTDTDPDELSVSALPFDLIREVFSGSPASNRVLVLDCCFSGRAIQDMGSQDTAILGQIGIEGSYTLCATGANAVALAPTGATHTAFTGELLALLRNGIVDGPQLLTFGTIFRALRYTMTTRGLPVPDQRGTGTIDLLALSRNVAYGAPQTIMLATSPALRETKSVPSSAGNDPAEEASAASPNASLGDEGVDPDQELPQARIPDRIWSNPRSARTPRADGRDVASAGESGYRLARFHQSRGNVDEVPKKEKRRGRFFGTRRLVESIAVVATAILIAVGLVALPGRDRGSDIGSVALSPDGKTLAAANLSDNNARLWDVASGKAISTLLGRRGDGFYDVAFSPDGKTLAAGGNDTTQLWDIHSGQVLATLPDGEGGDVWRMEYSPDGKTLAVADGWVVRLVDVASVKTTATFRGHDGSVYDVSFSPDGKTLATASSDNTARLWDVDTGRHLQSLIGHTRGLNVVSFSPDGKTIATGSSDNTARLWDPTTGQDIFTLRDHTSFVDCLAFSPDGKMLATGGMDGTVRLWNAASGSSISTLEDKMDAVRDVFFTPDGSTLLVGDYGPTFRSWNVATGHMTDRFDL